MPTKRKAKGLIVDVGQAEFKRVCITTEMQESLFLWQKEAKDLGIPSTLHKLIRGRLVFVPDDPVRRKRG